MDRIDLIQRLLDSGWTHDAPIDPDREKDCVHATFPHPRDVDVTFGVAPPEVEVLDEEALGRIVVRVENDRRKVQLASVVGDLVNRKGGSSYAENGAQDERTDAGHSSDHATGRVRAAFRTGILGNPDTIRADLLNENQSSLRPQLFSGGTVLRFYLERLIHILDRKQRRSPDPNCAGA